MSSATPEPIPDLALITRVMGLIRQLDELADNDTWLTLWEETNEIALKLPKVAGYGIEDEEKQLMVACFDLEQAIRVTELLKAQGVKARLRAAEQHNLIDMVHPATKPERVVKRILTPMAGEEC